MNAPTSSMIFELYAYHEWANARVIESLLHVLALLYLDTGTEPESAFAF